MSLEYPCIHYQGGKCKIFSGPEDSPLSFCVKGPCGFEKQSRADSIRSMTDEELAEFLVNTDICDYRSPSECTGFLSCEDCKLSWLQQPAEEEK